MEAVSVKYITVNGYSLLNIRLCFNIVALVHLLVVAFVTLTIDLTEDEDPKVRIYNKIRWNLLTCWFNLVTIFYLPICIYSDWLEKYRDGPPIVGELKKIRDLLMNSLLFPVIAYGDATFWVLYKWMPGIIAPPRVFEYLPYWAQHSLHTVSLIFVIMDLVLTPRKRPKSDKTNLAVLYAFSCFYTLVLYVSYLQGIIVYAYLETSSRTVCILSFFFSFFIVNVCYHLQWFIVDYVWGHKVIKLNKEDVNK